MKTIFSIIVCLINFSLSAQPVNENQPKADQGNGYYLNPVMPGNYGDPSIIRVDSDFYMAFSRGDGIMVWHSRDLVNWQPVARHHLPSGYKQVWAIDIQYFNGLFHVYMPINYYPGKKEGTKGFGNFVMTAKDARGPWSEPIKIDIPVPANADHWGAIDPGFVQTPEGKKYLYISAGWVIELDASGTRSVGKPQKVYDGWQYPADWNVQCKCLESPKLFYKDGFYYLVSAQGGTNGPSTAHMTVVARAKNATGPWENSPCNPLTHTYDTEEKWWHQGHGTIFSAADGSWWTVYHGRLNNYTALGRSTLLMPVEWTKDGWPVIKNSYWPAALIPKPAGENTGNIMPLSDDFTTAVLGMQWSYDYANKDLIKTGDGKLSLSASGKNHSDGTIVTLGAVNKSFEVTVNIEMPLQGAIAGIALDNDGLKFDGTSATFTEGPDWRMNDAAKNPLVAGHTYFKIKNYRKDISFYYSDDGLHWISFGKGIRKEESYRIKLFAAVEGTVTFKNFKYQGLE